MWPKRKVHLVVPPTDPEIAGVRALLKGMRLEFSEAEDPEGAFTESWWEEPFRKEGALEQAAPPTDVIFCIEEQDNTVWQEKIHAAGFRLQPLHSFIHSILADEIVLRVSEPTVFIEGRPLLGHILREAGFEPTILWPNPDGEWQCERRLGLHWIIPESWQADRDVGEEDHLTIGVKEKTTWVIREYGIDFYELRDGVKFIGRIPRWPEPAEEQIVAETIAKCLNLGVSWLDIRLALSSIWQNISVTNNLRWNINDTEWDAGTCGEELSSEPLNNVEDRRPG